MKEQQKSAWQSRSRKAPHRSALLAGAVLSFIGGCSGRGPGEAAPGPASLPQLEVSALSATFGDSIVLERGACFGICPVYRLRVSIDGGVHFSPGNQSDSISPETVASLFVLADSIGFYALPDSVSKSTKYCPSGWSDHPTFIVSVFGRSKTKTVVDYAGCYLPGRRVHEDIGRLRKLENAIDSAANAKRWIRPGSR